MKRFFLGGLLIIFGALLLLGNMNYISYDLGKIISLFWPALLIIWGLNELTDHLRYKGRLGLNNYFFPTLSMIIGFVLIGNNLDLFPNGDINVWNLIWPLFIIYIGLTFILPNRWKKPKVYVINRGHHKRNYKASVHTEGGKSMLLGSFEIGKEPWALEDSSYHIGVGEAKIDLTKAFIKEGKTNLQITGCTGQITLIIPSDIAVDINASLDLGSLTIFDEEHSGTPGFVAYKSADYDSAFKKLFIDVKLNIGEILIKQVN